MEETHILEIGIGLDYSKILNEENIYGVKLALGVQNDEELVLAYAMHIRNLIEDALRGRDELFIKESTVAVANYQQIENVDNQEELEGEYEVPETDEGEVDILNEDGYEQEDEEEYHQLNMDVTEILKKDLEMISDDSNITVEEIELKKGIVYSEDDVNIPEGVSILKGIEKFDEDIKYQANIPYRITTFDNITKEESTLLGGF